MIHVILTKQIDLHLFQEKIWSRGTENWTP